MVNIQQPTEEVELEMVENEYWARKAEKLLRLMENEDFKDVILEGYLKDRAVDQTSLLATDYIRQSGTRPMVMENLVAISAFESWMRMVVDKGTMPFNDEDEEDEG
jgi:hypothetical protein